MKLKEYERINELAIKQQEELIKKDQQYHVENAEELAAKFKREQFKKYQKITKEQTKKEKEGGGGETSKKTPFTSIDEAWGAQPVGKWEAVEPVKDEEDEIDLELPRQNNSFLPVATVQSDEPPVKKFKEKTITSLDTDDMPSTFNKKRKIGNRNIRRVNDDD